MTYHERPAKNMTDTEIIEELVELDDMFYEFRKDLDGMSGSPGEWMVERIDELSTELERRRKS